MARIDLNSIKKVEKEKYAIHSKVETTYSVFDSADERIIQIDTYGKSSRAIPGKISQSIQIDKETAQFLLKLFIDEYGLSVEIV